MMSSIEQRVKNTDRVVGKTLVLGAGSGDDAWDE
jgi:hypothetical protein